MSECQLNAEPFKQCCCNCKFHLRDHYHCTRDPEIREAFGKCICSIPRGWICAGFAMSQKDCDNAHSNWPEHSVGCELYTPKQNFESE